MSESERTERTTNESGVAGAQSDEIRDEAVDAEQSDGGPAEPESEVNPALQQLQEELEQVGQERDRLAIQYSRLRADFDNFRRRKTQEMESLKEVAASDLVERLLPVVDNLERAVASVEGGEGPLADGVRLVLRQFHQALQDSGVEPIPSVGQPFDPSLHEAMERIEPDEQHPPGTVVDELQKGYRLRGKVLRPGLVRVAADA